MNGNFERFDPVAWLDENYVLVVPPRPSTSKRTARKGAWSVPLAINMGVVAIGLARFSLAVDRPAATCPVVPPSIAWQEPRAARSGPGDPDTVSPEYWGRLASHLRALPPIEEAAGEDPDLPDLDADG
jgi:hypothetical protein